MRLYPLFKYDLYDFETKLKGLHKRINNETIMLTDNGMLKNIKGQMFIYKFNFKEKITMLKKYLDNKDYILTYDKWLKVEERYNMPFKHKIINIKKIIFETHKNSQVKFVFEIKDNKIHDYYFTFPENEENDPLIKEEINTFLERIN